MKVSPSRRNSASSRTRKSSGRAGRKGPKKNQKQDNTKLFIGLGVGAFFFLFIIIAAASGGSKSQRSTQYVSKKKEYSLPISARKEIYRAYSKIDDRLEDESQEKLSNLAGDEARKQGSAIRAEKKRLLYNAKVDLVKKFKKKYQGLNSSYMKKIIDEGIDKSW